jgi:hypothetical protein
LPSLSIAPKKPRLLERGVTKSVTVGFAGRGEADPVPESVAAAASNRKSAPMFAPELPSALEGWPRLDQYSLT